MVDPSPTCASCAAPMAGDQRYCLECGARRGPARLDLLAHARGGAASWPPAAAGVGRPTTSDPTAATPAGMVAAGAPAAFPGPPIVGLLTLGMLVAGFALGAVGKPESAASSVATGRRLVLLTGPPALGAIPAPTAPTAAEPPALPEAPDVSAGTLDELPVAPAPTLPAPNPVETVPAGGETPADQDTETPAAAVVKLPPVNRVWVITLADRGLADTFGPIAADPYLRDELVREGALLNNFHATARGTPANGIALLSGQGANAATDGDCAQATDVTPGTVAAGDDLQQVQGDGCVYPSTVGTLPEQLTAAGKRWKAYVEDVVPGGLSTAPNCEAARSPRNPFGYFRALTDAKECPERIVGTDGLAADLADPAKTPALSWIVPNACHDGRDAPCSPDAPAGLPAAGAWLRPVIDQIRATKAYQQGGLIVLLADRAPMDGPAPDVTARKGAPAGQGGGLVPALLLSPFVTPGQQIAAAYDHFSLLGSLEDLFGLSRLGQAGRPGLRTFGPRVFGAFTAEEK